MNERKSGGGSNLDQVENFVNKKLYLRVIEMIDQR